MVEGKIKTSYNVNYDLSKRMVAIFDEYDYFDLCRAVFCINSWRYTRPHLCLYLTLNYSFLRSFHLCQGVEFLGEKVDTVEQD